MARVLITGMSGAGKSTLLDELARRGYQTVDTDYDGWTTSDDGWDRARMSALLAGAPDVVVSGTVANQGRFYDRFDHIVLLSAPIDVLIDRVRTRNNNPYGHSEVEQTRIRNHVRDIEPQLRAGATLELDARRAIPELADVIARLMAPTRPPRSPLPR
jgi:dephospho-CoA kinase